MTSPVVREPGGEEGLAEIRDRRDPEQGIVEHRAAAAPADERLASDRVEHEAEFGAPGALERDRDRDLRVAVCEVRRAVERIDEPARIAGPVCARFLRDDGVSRKAAPQ